MASQGEREPGVVEMDVGLVESMAQDGDPEQDMGVQEQEPPQMDPEPEMGAATATVYDTSPPPLHQNPPILAESAQLSAPDIAQLFAMLAGMRGETQQMGKEMKNDIKEEMREMRGEMRQMGRCLQAFIMATPRAGTNELGGECNGCQARGGG